MNNNSDNYYYCLDLFLEYMPSLKEESLKIEHLLSFWTREGRYYHNEDHLKYIFDEIDKTPLTLMDRRTLMVAALFHDIIYDTKASDNEEKSAEYLKSFFTPITYQDSKIYKVVACQKFDLNQAIQIVLDTKKPLGDPMFTKLSWYFGNIDYSYGFANVGMPADKCEELIRKEYNWVPEDLFKENRIKFLESIIKRFPKAGNNIDFLKTGTYNRTVNY